MSVPYIPLYVSDYEADTAHLSIEEDGAYMRLLRLCWRTPGCSVPDDRYWIMRKMRVTPDEYQRVVEPIIQEFFTRGLGRVFNARLQREKQRIDDVSKKRSEAGRKGGRPAKALKPKETTESPAKAKQKHLEPEPEPDKERTSSGADAPSFSAFWIKWPNKVSRKAAEKAWKKLGDDDRRTAFERMDRWQAEWRRRHPDASPIHAATWINNRRWEDEFGPQQQTDAARVAMMEKFARVK